MRRLVDRIGTSRVGALCLLTCGGTFASLALLTAHLWHLYATFAVVGLAMTGTSAVVTPVVLMGRAFDATGSYEVVLLGFAIGSVAVATLMLLVPEPWVRGRARQSRR